MGKTIEARPTLFPAGATHSELAGKQRRFLAQELRGRRIVGDRGVFTCLEIMTIAAEGMAQEVASQRGDIDPESARFLSESVGERLNREHQPAAFCSFDVNREPFVSASRVNAAVIDQLHQAAVAIADQVVYEEVESQNLTAMRNGGQ